MEGQVITTTLIKEEIQRAIGNANKRESLVSCAVGRVTKEDSYFFSGWRCFLMAASGGVTKKGLFRT